jgi:hypothetical protein
MIDFGYEKQYQDAVKKIEQTFEHVKQANEFWLNSILSTWKSFIKTK